MHARACAGRQLLWAVAMETQNFPVDPRIRRVSLAKGLAAAVVRSLRDRIRVGAASLLARFRRNRTTKKPFHGPWELGTRKEGGSAVCQKSSAQKRPRPRPNPAEGGAK